MRKEHQEQKKSDMHHRLLITSAGVRCSAFDPPFADSSFALQSGRSLSFSSVCLPARVPDLPAHPEFGCPHRMPPPMSKKQFCGVVGGICQPAGVGPTPSGAGSGNCGNADAGATTATPHARKSLLRAVDQWLHVAVQSSWFR